MAPKPIAFASSSPVPETRPELAREVCSDLILATGCSDYPNQVNNVPGFPYIFRGALGVSALRINEDMQIAAVQALKHLTQLPVPESVPAAYGLDHLSFGPDYITPKPFDPRLRDLVPAAVARAAIASGVACLPWPAHDPPE